MRSSDWSSDVCSSDLAKEGARTTGLSVNTVNEHLKSARRKLGTSDSWSAAQLLRALENPTKSSDTNKSGSPRPSIVTKNHSTDTSAFAPVVVESSSVLPFAQNGRPWNARQSDVSGTSGPVCIALGGGRHIKNHTK